MQREAFPFKKMDGAGLRKRPKDAKGSRGYEVRSRFVKKRVIENHSPI